MQRSSGSQPAMPATGRARSLVLYVALASAVGACSGSRSHDESPSSKDGGRPDAASSDAGENGPAATDGATSAGDSGAQPRIEADQVGAPELIASGFALAESPLWDVCHDELLFTDVTGDFGNGLIHKLGSDGEVGVFASYTSNTNGMAFDVDGSLILAQMGGAPGHIARRDAERKTHVLEPMGSPMLHTPDDVVVRSDGSIYFSDGDFYPIGSLLGFAAQLPVYLLRPEAEELVAVATVSGPNGVELSPDEKTFYVSAYGAGEIRAYDVEDDGALSNERTLLSGLARPDSLCIDSAGNLYVGVSTGLQVARPDGELVTLIPIPATATGGTTNCTFGGADGRTLFITSWDSVYKVEDMPIPGLDWVVGLERQVCD